MSENEYESEALDKLANTTQGLFDELERALAGVKETVKKGRGAVSVQIKELWNATEKQNKAWRDSVGRIGGKTDELWDRLAASKMERVKLDVLRDSLLLELQDEGHELAWARFKKDCRYE